MLEALDLGKRLDKKEYRERLPRLQARLHQLQRACSDARLATVIVFEGWDAAGKGAVIRKLTQRLEPRAFKLHATREARTLEAQLPWMWRFWQKLPNWGEIAIFDRSWYGRVIIDRVEKLVDEETARRSLRDIVAFERTLADDRYEIVKFFLHIDPGTQKKRLEKLAAGELTAWQVRDEDWHRHEHYDGYREAIERMLAETESEWGPWTLVEAVNKRWARARVLGVLVERMEAALSRRGHELPPALDTGDSDRDDDPGD